MQMAEHRQRNAPYRMLGNAHENDIAQFGKQRVRQTQHAVGGEQHQWQHQHRLPRVEGIDDFLHHQRHADVGDLGGDQKYQRQQDAAAILP